MIKISLNYFYRREARNNLSNSTQFYTAFIYNIFILTNYFYCPNKLLLVFLFFREDLFRNSLVNFVIASEGSKYNNI